MPSLRFIFNRIATSVRAYRWRRGHGPDGSPKIASNWRLRMAQFYQHWLPPIVLIAVFGWLASVLYFSPPSPPIGVYMGGLACLAAVVTIWPPQSSWSKAAWMLVFFAMFGLEIHTLYKDREANQSQQRVARKESNDAFKSIADGLKAAIDANQKAFDSTMRSMQGLSDLTTENQKEATGADSFCWLTLNGSALEQNVAIPGFFHNGKYPLYEVEARIANLDLPISAADLTINIGTIMPGHAKNVNVRIPTASTGRMYLNVFFFARNGDWIQRFRAQKINNQWAFASQSRRGDKVLMERSDPGYPRGPDGKVEWDSMK